MIYTLLTIAVLLLSSGDPAWAGGWLYVGTLLAGQLATAWTLALGDAALLRERSSAASGQGTVAWDRRLAPLTALGPLACGLVAGLAVRFGWEPRFAPVAEAAGIALYAAGLLLGLWAMTSNPFFTPVVRIRPEQGHTVATGGPYRFVRHPGTAGALLADLAGPLILASPWAIVPAAIAAGLILLRMLLEDCALREELLPGAGLTASRGGSPRRPATCSSAVVRLGYRSMLLGIDHLVIAVADPDDAAACLEEAVGLAATGGGRHDALGTFNRLVWLGDSYIELLGIFDRALAERSWIGAPALEALDRGGGLATWAIATDALSADLAARRVGGSELGDPIDGRRRRADGALVRWRLAAPRRLGQAEPPFLIEHDGSAAEWTPADRAARRALAHPLGGPARLAVLELSIDDVSRTTLRFSRTVGLRFRPSLAGAGARDADIGGQTVRLRPRGGGLGAAAVHLVAAVPEERGVELLGCRWVVRPAR